jgi:hypothetical protein
MAYFRQLRPPSVASDQIRRMSDMRVELGRVTWGQT